MVEPGEPRVDENGVPEVRTQDILKEGYLLKQSRYIKDWRNETTFDSSSHQHNLIIGDGSSSLRPTS
ncbi:hypothetical protein FGO68_gene16897 [Halteria grandinella]|uniref:Uncharacterized protein n=1 Tax=Halteria grandinella TaxID=5974 RepID=A0A8J8T7S4_HALGN|nr:hypothetical protein FGO68_gene16897 [Halteria grandinella]